VLQLNVLTDSRKKKSDQVYGTASILREDYTTYWTDAE